MTLQDSPTHEIYKENLTIQEAAHLSQESLGCSTCIQGYPDPPMTFQQPEGLVWTQRL